MKSFSRWMHTSSAAAMLITIAVAFLLVSAGGGEDLPGQGEQGLCLPSPALWAIPRPVDIAGGVALCAGLMVMMWFINKAFNVLRSATYLQLGLFAIMAAAVPRLVVNINSGILLALAVNVCVLLLFGCYGAYDHPAAMRKVFLSFLILSIGAAFQYCFIFFIPVLWVVLAQMRIFSFRSVLASLLGLITPWIILLGFEIVTFEDFHLPEVSGIFRSFEESSALYFLADTAVTALLLIGAIAFNLTKTIAYNAQARAYNGALTLIAVVTIVAIIANYNNLLAYLPLLNVCAAYQITHWLINHQFNRQYYVVVALLIIYFTLYLWRMTL